MLKRLPRRQRPSVGWITFNSPIQRCREDRLPFEYVTAHQLAGWMGLAGRREIDELMVLLDGSDLTVSTCSRVNPIQPHGVALLHGGLRHSRVSGLLEQLPMEGPIGFQIARYVPAGDLLRDLVGKPMECLGVNLAPSGKRHDREALEQFTQLKESVEIL